MQVGRMQCVNVEGIAHRSAPDVTRPEKWVKSLERGESLHALSPRGLVVQFASSPCQAKEEGRAHTSLFHMFRISLPLTGDVFLDYVESYTNGAQRTTSKQHSLIHCLL